MNKRRRTFKLRMVRGKQEPFRVGAFALGAAIILGLRPVHPISATTPSLDGTLLGIDFYVEIYFETLRRPTIRQIKLSLIKFEKTLLPTKKLSPEVW
jgi:hypothetical protein